MLNLAVIEHCRHYIFFRFNFMPLISYSHQKKRIKNFHTDWFDLLSRHGARFSEGHCTFDQTAQPFFYLSFFLVMMKVKEKFWMKSQRKLTVSKKCDAVCDQWETEICRKLNRFPITVYSHFQKYIADILKRITIRIFSTQNELGILGYFSCFTWLFILWCIWILKKNVLWLFIVPEK